MYRLDRRNKIISYGRAHFWFELNGKKYGYCYIRKNACSAFKKLICETSKVAKFSEHTGTELQFMEAHHRIRTYEQLQSCDHLIFVYRAPYDRLVSAYVNKFVVQTGHNEIFRSYEQQTGKAPESASFRDFIIGYCKEFREKDVHIFPQHLHLLPSRYDSVLSIETLYEDISDLMGPRSQTAILPAKLTAAITARPRTARSTCVRPFTPRTHRNWATPIKGGVLR